jgi:hypothetical protein
MLICTIHIDGQPYCGEDIEHSYRPGSGTKTNAWLCYTGEERDLPLIGTGEPKRIEGFCGLRNALELLVSWMKDGVLEAKDITITVKGNV